MMKRSMKVFSEKEAPTSSPKLLQQMHLHKDGTVSLTCYKIKNAVESRDDIAWSATVQVRGKKETATPAIELLISSSIPSFGSNASTPQIQQERQRLVRKHSRLSVPVLKSILQKSIRRRKPLPSVRVASELADKSLGDLLRRLPIIILEDSTLHPSFPFLVWLMMADSKNYHLPLFLLKRVLGIVFEMASCRWQDSLKVHEQQKINHNDESTTDIPSELTLACLHNYKTVSKFSDDNALSTQSGTEFCLSNDELIVWSILMRGQYGGMACDIKMLKGYAALWHQRFFSIQTIPEKTKKILSPHGPCPSITTSDEIVLEEWSQVPVFVHQSAAKQSASRIDRLLMATPMGSFSRPQSQKAAQNKNNNFVGLISLGKSDLTVEGVDFHCSSILESAILSNPKVVEDCCDHLEAIDRKYGHGNSSTGNDRRTRSLHSSLRGVLKSCMWKYSAGVNLRLPLLTAGGSTEDKREGVNDLKQFYENVIKPRTKAFAERYVEDRLSR
ncbi:unnamed protein product [Pseudo-nitzschia multistriata]|uniref:Uncharacterized protein n=1 Tax=Pseudo-nitzschia multistriata TaxID=183589 RepID=A0A448ZPZ8_9STRA|nr:unnamed protein product [Pseudo-nitzschia multistriata]